VGFRRLLLVPLFFCGAVALGLGVPFACSSPAPLAASGQACFQVTDCMEGLVCVPLPPQCNGNRVCSSDLTCVQSIEFDAAADGGAGGGDAPATGTDAPAPVDTGTVTKDTGTVKDTAAKDTATPVEAGGG
jgi:hypothetical protein